MEPALLPFSTAVFYGNDATSAHDGVLNFESAVYGTFLGCVAADHMEQVGWWPSPFPNLLSGHDRFELFDRIIENLVEWESS